VNARKTHGRFLQLNATLSWELRVAMSLSRLCQPQGKRVEGFDPADLQEAKALLAALSG
jgi:hypothetical protein